ncbi:MAG: terminase [Brevundimonas sp.]|nr:MAG: terminase [Brevundimonas sp.]
MSKLVSSNNLSKVALAALNNPDAAVAALRRREEMRATRERCMSLAGFVHMAWPILEPETVLHWGWANDAIATHLEAVTAGDITRLLINVPPGFMKSLLTSVFWPAWEWGPRGKAGGRWLTTSYKEDLAKRDATKMRSLVMSPWYQQHWPLVLERGGDSSFENSAKGWRKATAITSMTGHRGDRIVVDDPHSTESAESQAKRATTARLMTESIPTRLNDPKASAIVVIMQRLHTQDASGQILQDDPSYEHLCLPMRFEKDRRCRTSIGFVDPRLAEDELLDDVRYDEPSLAALEKKLGPVAVAGQFQQRPAPREGLMFKRSWFEIVPLVPQGGQQARAWDLAATAFTGTGDPDWTVGLCGMRVNDGTIIITGMERFRVGAGELLERIRQVARRDGWPVRQRLPQDPGSSGKVTADWFARELLAAGLQVQVGLATDDKQTRATPVCGWAAEGKVKLLKGDWNEVFLEEVCNFPVARHDDIVDALSDLHAELNRYAIYALGNVS